MKIVTHIVPVGIVCAAIAVGGWTGVAICDWIVPKPEGGAKFAETSVSTAVVNSTKTTRPAGKNRNWIADVWSGPRRTGAFKVTGVSADGKVETQCVDAGRARRWLGEAICRALRKHGKAPLEERYARRADDPFDTPEARRRSHGSSFEDEDKGPIIYEGDVYISGLPMVNQGNRAYCAVASAARVLQGYGIEVTMDDMAVLANSSETGGTNLKNWEQALRQVAGEHGLELKVVPELTLTTVPLDQLVCGYNDLAGEMGYDELALSDYVYPLGSWVVLNDYGSFENDCAYPVQRELMLADDGKCDAFDENVTTCINGSDPLFWSVTLGNIPEQGAYGKGTTLANDRGGHMRLIIGYNEERGEVLYSDSWGEGHELKRMDASDALSITRGLYYLADKCQ